MSFDLMIFDDTAPKEQASFLNWYEKCCKWEEPHDYQNYRITSPALQNFYLELIQQFPPMNGEFAPTEDELEDDPVLENHVTDYSIGQHCIYAAFAWSMAEQAYQTVIELNSRYPIGFYNPSNPNFEILYNYK